MSETIKRITPEEALEAFVTQKLKPARNNYFPSDGCACGLGAMAQHLELVSLGSLGQCNNRETRVNLIGFYGEEYHNGFARGFDNNENDDPENVAFVQGYEDGQAVWEAVKHLAVTE